MCQGAPNPLKVLPFQRLGRAFAVTQKFFPSFTIAGIIESFKTLEYVDGLLLVPTWSFLLGKFCECVILPFLRITQ